MNSVEDIGFATAILPHKTLNVTLKVKLGTTVVLKLEKCKFLQIQHETIGAAFPVGAFPD
jgi:hypothetical protein